MLRAAEQAGSALKPCSYAIKDAGTVDSFHANSRVAELWLCTQLHYRFVCADVAYIFCVTVSKQQPKC